MSFLIPLRDTTIAFASRARLFCRKCQVIDHDFSHYINHLLPPANEVCEGYVFTGVCLSTGGVSVQGGLCLGVGLCPGGSLQGVSLSRERGLCPGRGVSVQGWGSLSRGISVWGGLCPGGSLSRRPP